MPTANWPLPRRRAPQKSDAEDAESTCTRHTSPRTRSTAPCAAPPPLHLVAVPSRRILTPFPAPSTVLLEDRARPGTRTLDLQVAPHAAGSRRQGARGTWHETPAVPQPRARRQGAPAQGQEEPRRVEGRLAEPREAPRRAQAPVRRCSALREGPTSCSCLFVAGRSVKEVSKGYFHDYNELRQQGGKAYVAPKTLIREDVRSPSALPLLCEVARLRQGTT